MYFSEDPSGWGVMCSGILVRETVVLTAGRCIGSTTTGTEAASRVASLSAKVYVGAGAPGSFQLLHAADAVSGVYLWAPGMPGSNIGLAQIEWRPEAANDSRVLAARSAIVPLLSSVVNSTTSFPPPLPGQSPRPLPSLQPGGDQYGSGPSAEELDRLTRVGFPFASTLVGYGAAQGQEGTVGEQRFVHRSGRLQVTNRSYVTLRSLGCRDTIRGGSWMGEGANTTDGAQACIAGGDLGAPLLAEFEGNDYIIGIAERGDNSPCSDTRTWFTSVLFRAEFLSRELQLIDNGDVEACPSASPSPTATGSPTPTGTATPSPSPSPSEVAVVAVVPSPPPPPAEPFPLGLVLAILLAIGLLALLMILLWAILMCTERHRRVRPTTFDVLVVARPEDRRLVQEKRSEMKEVAAHQGEHHAAECEQCRKFQEEKERRRAMVEAGLEEATPSTSDAGSEAGGDNGTAGEADDTRVPATEEQATLSQAVAQQAPLELPDDPVMQAQLLRASGSVAVVVDRTAGTLFLPDTLLAGRTAVEEAPAGHAASRMPGRPAASSAVSRKPAAPLALLEEVEDGPLRLVYAGPHDALPVRADNDPRAIKHIVRHHLLRSLTVLHELPEAHYLGRVTDLAQLRQALGASDWAAATVRAEAMLRRQAVLQSRLGDESRATTARASAAASSRPGASGAKV